MKIRNISPILTTWLELIFLSIWCRAWNNIRLPIIIFLKHSVVLRLHRRDFWYLEFWLPRFWEHQLIRSGQRFLLLLYKSAHYSVHFQFFEWHQLHLHNQHLMKPSVGHYQLTLLFHQELDQGKIWRKSMKIKKYLFTRKEK